MKIAILILLVVGAFLGLFHVVGTGAGITIIPKTSFTFSNTFSTVDEIVKRHNGQGLGERLRGDPQFDNLVRALQERHFITDRNEARAETANVTPFTARPRSSMETETGGVASVDYPDVKSAILDSQNAVGKTIQLVAKYRELELISGRPVIHVWVTTDTGSSFWRVSFDSQMNSTMKSLRQDQPLKIVCTIRELSNGISSCDLIKLMGVDMPASIAPQATQSSITPQQPTVTPANTVAEPYAQPAAKPTNAIPNVKLDSSVESVDSKVKALVLAVLTGNQTNRQSMVDDIKVQPKREHGDRKTARRLNGDALLALRNDNFDAAMKLLMQARDADIGDVEVRENLAYTQMKSGLLDEAELTLMTVFADAPDRASAWGTFGQVFGLRDKEEQAIACLLTAYKYSRNQKKTIEVYQRLADSDPDVRVQSAAKKSLAILQDESVISAN